MIPQSAAGAGSQQPCGVSVYGGHTWGHPHREDTLSCPPAPGSPTTGSGARYQNISQVSLVSAKVVHIGKAGVNKEQSSQKPEQQETLSDACYGPGHIALISPPFPPPPPQSCKVNPNRLLAKGIHQQRTMFVPDQCLHPTSAKAQPWLIMVTSQMKESSTFDRSVSPEGI